MNFQSVSTVVDAFWLHASPHEIVLELVARVQRTARTLSLRAKLSRVRETIPARQLFVSNRHIPHFWSVGVVLWIGN